jgi:chitin synthase
MNPFVKGLSTSRAIATRRRIPATGTRIDDRIGTAVCQAGVRTGEEHDVSHGRGAVPEDDQGSEGARLIPGRRWSQARSAHRSTPFSQRSRCPGLARFCINPNESRVQTLPNQLEGRSVKGQVRSAGLAQIGLGGWDIIC